MNYPHCGNEMTKEQMEKRIVELEQQLAQERAKTPTVISFPPTPAPSKPEPYWPYQPYRPWDGTQYTEIICSARNTGYGAGLS